MHAIDLKRFSENELEQHERDLADATVAVREEKIRRKANSESTRESVKRPSQSWWLPAKRELFRDEVLPNREAYAEADAIYTFIVSATDNDCEQRGPQDLEDAEFIWCSHMADLEAELGLPLSYGLSYGESDCESQSDGECGGGECSSSDGGACSSSDDGARSSSDGGACSSRSSCGGGRSSGGSGGNTGSGGGPSAAGP